MSVQSFALLILAAVFLGACQADEEELVDRQKTEELGDPKYRGTLLVDVGELLEAEEGANPASQQSDASGEIEQVDANSLFAPDIERYTQNITGETAARRFIASALYERSFILSPFSTMCIEDAIEGSGKNKRATGCEGHEDNARRLLTALREGDYSFRMPVASSNNFEWHQDDGGYCKSFDTIATAVKEKGWEPGLSTPFTPISVDHHFSPEENNEKRRFHTFWLFDVLQDEGASEPTRYGLVAKTTLVEPGKPVDVPPHAVFRLVDMNACKILMTGLFYGTRTIALDHPPVMAGDYFKRATTLRRSVNGVKDYHYISETFGKMAVIQIDGEDYIISVDSHRISAPRTEEGSGFGGFDLGCPDKLRVTFHGDWGGNKVIYSFTEVLPVAPEILEECHSAARERQKFYRERMKRG